MLRNIVLIHAILFAILTAFLGQWVYHQQTTPVAYGGERLEEYCKKEALVDKEDRTTPEGVKIYLHDKQTISQDFPYGEYSVYSCDLSTGGVKLTMGNASLGSWSMLVVLGLLTFLTLCFYALMRRNKNDENRRQNGVSVKTNVAARAAPPLPQTNPVQTDTTTPPRTLGDLYDETQPPHQ